VNRGGEQFSDDIDKFARVFMVPGSKSLVSFSELERKFYDKYADMEFDEEYSLNQKESFYKEISYSLIRNEIDLSKEFEGDPPAMTVKEFKEFIESKL